MLDVSRYLLNVKDKEYEVEKQCNSYLWSKDDNTLIGLQNELYKLEMAVLNMKLAVAQ